MLKFSILLLALCGFLFFSTGMVWADDISDLKEQVKALQETINNQQKTIEDLNSKVQAVETKQQAQASEIKKVPELAQKVDDLKESSIGQLAEGLSVGGHVKLYMFDRTQGKRSSLGTDYKQHTNLSSGVGTHAFVLYITKQLSDTFKIDTATDFGVSASATPSLGSDITRATTGTLSTTLRKLTMEAALPNGYELKVGMFNPMFVEEFAKETFWDEQYNMNNGLCYLESWHDSGISLYKNFDFDKCSLPVYLELLNGGSSQYVDNNDAKTVLVHVAPELFQTKLRLLHSLAYGRWGEGENGEALFASNGLEWKYQKVNLSGEYIYKKYNNVSTLARANADGKREGYYLKAMYTFNPTWRALVKYSHAELYKTGLSAMRTDTYDTTALGLNYFLTPSSDIITEYQFTEANRSDEINAEGIRAHRVTMGWRTTF